MEEKNKGKKSAAYSAIHLTTYRGGRLLDRGLLNAYTGRENIRERGGSFEEAHPRVITFNTHHII